MLLDGSHLWVRTSRRGDIATTLTKSFALCLSSSITCMMHLEPTVLVLAAEEDGDAIVYLQRIRRVHLHTIIQQAQFAVSEH